MFNRRTRSDLEPKNSKDETVLPGYSEAVFQLEGHDSWYYVPCKWNSCNRNIAPRTENYRRFLKNVDWLFLSRWASSTTSASQSIEDKIAYACVFFSNHNALKTYLVHIDALIWGEKNVEFHILLRTHTRSFWTTLKVIVKNVSRVIQWRGHTLTAPSTNENSCSRMTIRESRSPT